MRACVAWVFLYAVVVAAATDTDEVRGGEKGWRGWARSSDGACGFLYLYEITALGNRERVWGSRPARFVSDQPHVQSHSHLPLGG